MKMGMQNSTTELLNLKEVIQSRIILKLQGNLKELDKTTSKDKFKKKNRQGRNIQEMYDTIKRCHTFQV